MKLKTRENLIRHKYRPKIQTHHIGYLVAKILSLARLLACCDIEDGLLGCSDSSTVSNRVEGGALTDMDYVNTLHASNCPRGSGIK